MRRMGYDSGEGRAGCLFWLLVVLVAVMVGFKVIPVKIATMQLKDFMEELAMTQSRQTGAFFVREISNKAKELDLDIPKKQIKVRKSAERVVIDIDFVVPLDFYFYQHDWNIHLHLDRDIYII